MSKNVLVVGVFDLFHRGHVELLRRARSFGDRLVVIVNGDALTSEYKRKPMFSEVDRCEIIKSLRFVDDVVISNEFDVKPFIETHAINVIVHGDDWPHEAYLKQIRCTPEYIAERRIEMVYLEYYAGISTSKILRSIEATADAL